MARKGLNLKPRGVPVSQLILGELLREDSGSLFLVNFPEVKVLISSVYLSEGMPY